MDGKLHFMAHLGIKQMAETEDPMVGCGGTHSHSECRLQTVL